MSNIIFQCSFDGQVLNTKEQHSTHESERISKPENKTKWWKIKACSQTCLLLWVLKFSTSTLLRYYLHYHFQILSDIFRLYVPLLLYYALIYKCKQTVLLSFSLRLSFVLITSILNIYQEKPKCEDCQIYQ